MILHFNLSLQQKSSSLLEKNLNFLRICGNAQNVGECQNTLALIITGKKSHQINPKYRAFNTDSNFDFIFHLQILHNQSSESYFTKSDDTSDSCDNSIFNSIMHNFQKFAWIRSLKKLAR